MENKKTDAQNLNNNTHIDIRSKFLGAKEWVQINTQHI